MSRTFRDTLASDAAILFATFGEPALYRVPGRTDQSISFVDDDQSQRRGASGGESLDDDRRVQILRSEVDSPQQNVTLVIDDEEWTIVGRAERDAVVTTVRIRRVGQIQRSRPGLRDRRSRDDGRDGRGE